MKEDFHGSKDHRWTSMLESVLEKVHYIKFLLIIGRVILWANVENDTLTPLIEVFDTIQERYDECSINLDAAFVGLNLIDRFDCVDHNQWISIFG